MNRRNNLRYAAMRRLVDAGWSLQRIGDKFGLSRERVRQIVGNVGRDRSSPRKRAIVENIDAILKMWQEGKSLPRIAQITGIPAGCLYQHLDLLPRIYVPPVPVHGTRHAYVRFHCRCRDCRMASAEYIKQRRQELRSQGKCIRCRAPSPDHHYCPACRQKINDGRRKRRA